MHRLGLLLAISVWEIGTRVTEGGRLGKWGSSPGHWRGESSLGAGEGLSPLRSEVIGIAARHCHCSLCCLCCKICTARIA